MPTKKINLVEISFQSDELILTGTLHLPAVDQAPVVIGSHGLYSSRQSPKQIALARACNALGMAYFRFDHRGCGSSQGAFEHVTSLTARCTDLKQALAAIQCRPEIGRGIGLFGSSMGGTVCLSVAAQLEVNTVVTFAAPLCSSIDDVQRLERSNEQDTPQIFLDPAKSHFNISENVSRVNNILIIHGQKDETVPLSHAEEIHRLAGDPKKLIVQHNGDHRMSDESHQREFIRDASLWFRDRLMGGQGPN
jgi:alpha-beta hydrolase superfamily lysophospholipase